MAFGRRKAQSVPKGRIQVKVYSGRPIIDPTPDALRQMVLTFPDDEFVIVASSADPNGTYIQTLCRSDGLWVVEAQDGSDESHVHAFVPDRQAAADLLVLWAAGDPAWREAATWQDGSGA